MPVLIMLVAQVGINILLAYIMTFLSKADIGTALYSCAAGGLSDIVLIASEGNSDVAKITAYHVIRVISVVIFYPILLRFIL